jgi:hypothetical protein
MTTILHKDGLVNYYGKILAYQEANQYLDLLMRNILWKNDEVVIFGKHIVTKRKAAWYGDSDYLYTYSNITKQALPWTKELYELKQIVEDFAGTTYYYLNKDFLEGSVLFDLLLEDFVLCLIHLLLRIAVLVYWPL